MEGELSEKNRYRASLQAMERRSVKGWLILALLLVPFLGGNIAESARAVEETKGKAAKVYEPEALLGWGWGLPGLVGTAVGLPLIIMGLLNWGWGLKKAGPGYKGEHMYPAGPGYVYGYVNKGGAKPDHGVPGKGEAKGGSEPGYGVPKGGDAAVPGHGDPYKGEAKGSDGYGAQTGNRSVP